MRAHETGRMRVLVGSNQSTVFVDVGGRDCFTKLGQLFACLGPDSDLTIVSYEIDGEDIPRNPRGWFGKLTFVRNVVEERSM